jgi:hypothetical protein
MADDFVDPAALWEAHLAAQAAQRPAQPLPQAALRCPNGHPTATAAKFCSECGAALVTPDQDWTCTGGHHNEASAKFCPQCGVPRFQPPVVGAGASVEMAARPLPDEQLSPQQRAEREAQHAAAIAAGARDPGLRYQPPTSADTVLIHFIEDGLTYAGKVWMRGEELELDKDPNNPRWREAQVWINMDRWQQIEAYGAVKFAPGPWPGKRYSDGAGQFQRLRGLGANDADVMGPSPEVLEQADRQAAARRRGVPLPVR